MEDVAEDLRAKRAQLRTQLDEMSAPTELDNISFGKRVGEGTSQAVDRLSAVPAHAKLLDLLAEVDRALAKMDDGSYGRCDVCDEEIPAGRLEARPWATRCLRHAG
jgi:DnaK suppressor protein